MNEEKIGMYTTTEIYEELASGFLQHSMVDAMYFEIKQLQQRVEQLEKENILLKEANNYHQEVIKSMKEPENAHHYHLENIKLRAKNEQLENIIKEAIEYINHATIGADSSPIEDSWLYNLYKTRYILNKGDNNVKD